MTTKNKAAHEAVQAELCQNDRHMLALQCTWDISGIAEAVTLMADEAEADGNIAPAALLRCYGMRIATLNSQVMSYLDMDHGVTAEHMHKAIFGNAKSFEEVAV
ncbi:hypothetical protein [Comamonas sp. NoAH]|uniref:hypothetical protein n=1 Tax=Comamonas halotolerans TaxID=3041496 RepID=UPI0024E0EBC6|nr:hypothetical protein [Comamonas sp. NoAH]